MRQVTVCWDEDADSELADLWLAADDRRTVEQAANEIEQLLRVNPSAKGRPFALATLDEDSARVIAERTLALPEDLRWMRCGPLEVFFEPRELDCQVRVYHVRLRRDS
jgi:hypothetical protein